MAFWGIELKPTSSFTHKFDKARGRLHISLATLGWGGSTKKSVVQCNIGNKSTILLCSLLPEKAECCPLNIEFEESEDVTFSIVGPRSVHLAGYYLRSPRHSVDNNSESESYGEDIGETDSENSRDASYDEYESDFIDDGELEIAPPRTSKGVRKNSGELKTGKCNGSRKRLRRKYQVSDSDGDDAALQEAIRGNDVISDSEDKDNNPISSLCRSKIPNFPEAEKETRKAEVIERNTEPNLDAALKGVNRRKKKKKQEVVEAEVGESGADLLARKSDMKKDGDQAFGNNNGDTSRHNAASKEKLIDDKEELELAVGESNGRLKKKREEKIEDEGSTTEGGEPIVLPGKDHVTNANSSEENLNVNSEKKKKKRSRRSERREEQVGSSKWKTSDELVIEKLSSGRLDGKMASNGNKVAIFYTGRLMQNGLVFDSNVGGKPYKLRLGKLRKKLDGHFGPVLQCLEAGIRNMRVGERRRVQIPPSMGYGSKGKGEVPGNSWLEYDIELVSAK